MSRFTKGTKLAKKQRESDIEKKVTQYAKREKWVSFKWVSPSQRGVPDRLYFKEGKVKIVEFKAPGKKPTKGQNMIHKILGRCGFTVHVVDNVEQGVFLFTKSPTDECCL